MKSVSALRDEYLTLRRSGAIASLEEFFTRHTELQHDSTAATELIVAEIERLAAIGEHPAWFDFAKRFPHCAADLKNRCDTVRPDDFATQMPAAPASNDPNATIMERSPQASRPDAGDTAENFATLAPNAQDRLAGSLADDAASTFLGGPEIPGYEILGELGRGGMGVVYRARQLSAGRTVALKVVRNDVLEMLPLATQASTLDRFRNEAQAAAKLEHDNLVAVYEVADSGSLRYYAMRFVEGASLYDLLKNGPLENRRAAKYLAPTAHALGYAHMNGVLHRDLKPHNIMIDSRTDRPLVTDFGLAKNTEGENELTHDGTVMGTPSYMSPEQARDSSKVTASADIYSLGATLYHVLTGRPPFQAANMAETIRQVMFEEPVAPHVLNRLIDRDLETICLKCLQKEPVRRYETAEALAEDLERYLEGRPILARPVGSIERTFRWCKRNPVLAGVLALAACLAIATSVSIVVGYRNTSLRYAQSEKRLAQALAVVDDLFTRISENDLLNEPGMQPLRKELLQRALAHYQLFLAESGGKAAIREEAAVVRYRVGYLLQETGETQESLRQFHEAAALQRELLAEASDDPKRLKSLGDTLNALGAALKKQNELKASLAALLEAQEIRDRLVRTQPNEIQWQRLLANTIMNRGLVQIALDAAVEGRAAMEQAQAMREKLLEEHPRAGDVRRDAAMGYWNLGEYALDHAPEETEAFYRLAVKQFEILRSLDERNLANRYYLAQSFRMLGGLRADAGDVPAALDEFRRALPVIQSLAVGNPSVVRYQIEFASLQLTMAKLLNASDDAPAACKMWDDADIVLTGVLERNPERDDIRQLRADVLYDVADAAQAASLESLALRRQRYEKALREWEALSKGQPENQDLLKSIDDLHKAIKLLNEEVSEESPRPE